MTDNEIIKALECLAYHKECPESEECQYYMDNKNICDNVSLAKDALDLINRQKAEIEELRADNNYLFETMPHMKTEAIKEFAERLKEKATSTFYEEHKYIDTEDIDNLVKEMTEVSK